MGIACPAAVRYAVYRFTGWVYNISGVRYRIISGQRGKRDFQFYLSERTEKEYGTKGENRPGSGGRRNARHLYGRCSGCLYGEKYNI